MEYKFKINEFEGPLDLLLHLIKESEMDIFDIEIVKLTDQYLNYIESMKKLNLNVASEYLVLASELMYLKSKTLLPKTEDEDESDEYIEAKEDLINRLLEYKQYKEVTNTLRVLEESRSEIFTKEMSNLEDYRNEEIKLNDDISLEDLVDAFKKYLERMEYKKPISTRVATKEISVKERRQSIRKILLKKKKVEFFDLF